jgi:hypothetical protein
MRMPGRGVNRRLSLRHYAAATAGTSLLPSPRRTKKKLDAGFKLFTNLGLDPRPLKPKATSRAE